MSFLPAEGDDFRFITDRPIQLEQILSRCHREAAGAVVLFSGEVRNQSHGRPVSHLVYESFVELSEKVFIEILSEAVSKFGLHVAFCQHRIGRISVGESAVVVVTASAHRKAGYEGNQYIIDRVKSEAPIWKHEYFLDGTETWVANA